MKEKKKTSLNVLKKGFSLEDNDKLLEYNKSKLLKIEEKGTDDSDKLDCISDLKKIYKAIKRMEQKYEKIIVNSSTTTITNEKEEEKKAKLEYKLKFLTRLFTRLCIKLGHDESIFNIEPFYYEAYAARKYFEDIDKLKVRITHDNKIRIYNFGTSYSNTAIVTGKDTWDWLFDQYNITDDII